MRGLSLENVRVAFGRWGRNARVLVATEPLWSVPMSWIFFYRSIFLKDAIGLSEVEIGLLSTVSTVLTIVFPMLGGYLADRFGRKISFMVFDSMCWLSCLTIWLLTRDLWYALVAYTLEGLASIVYPIWECLLVEDTSPEYRAGIYAYISAIWNFGALSTPIAGYFISVYGVDYGCRLLFAIGLVSFSLMFTVRWIYLRETEAGYRLMKERVMAGVGGYKASLSVARKNPVILALIALSVFNTAFYASSIYIPLYLVDRRGIWVSEGEAAFFPLASSISSILLLTVVVSKLTSRSGYVKALLLGYSSGLAGMVILLSSPTGMLASVLAAGLLLGLHSATGFSVSRTFLTNEIELVDSRVRAKLLSITSTLSSLVNLPTPTIVGYLYTLNPRFFVCVLIWVFSLAVLTLSLAMRRAKKYGGF